jgi:hypothetical protein
MSGRTTFREDEIAELRALIREKQTADRDRQKALRARMRRMGFYITEFGQEPGGFTVSDLDELIQRGTITITGGGTQTVPPDPRETDLEPRPCGSGG